MSGRPRPIGVGTLCQRHDGSVRVTAVSFEGTTAPGDRIIVGMIGLHRGVFDGEALVQHRLDLTPNLVAIHMALHMDVT